MSSRSASCIIVALVLVTLSSALFWRKEASTPPAVSSTALPIRQQQASRSAPPLQQPPIGEALLDDNDKNNVMLDPVHFEEQRAQRKRPSLPPPPHHLPPTPTRRPFRAQAIHPGKNITPAYFRPKMMDMSTLRTRTDSSDAYWADCSPSRKGKRTPHPLCTKSNPCTNLSLAYVMTDVKKVDVPIFDDFHCGSGWGIHPKTGRVQYHIFDGERGGYGPGGPSYIDVPTASQPESRRRFFCQYFPPKNDESIPTDLQDSEGRIPVIIAFPASGGNATCAVSMGLRHYAEEMGFAVVASQGLNMHWRATGFAGTPGGEDGSKHDDVFRDVDNNDDVKFVDTLIDALVGAGRVDPKRIYLSGGSNGCSFASFYGILRSGSTDGGALGKISGETPEGGHRVAAVACYSGWDPFVGVGWRKECHTIPRPKSTLPILMLSRLCDLVMCYWIRDFMEALKEEIGSKEAKWILLDRNEKEISHSMCSEEQRRVWCPTPSEDARGHALWPISFVPGILEFLFKHSS